MLGFKPTRERLHQLGMGLLLPLAFYSALFFGISWLVKNPLLLNPAYSLADLGGSSLYIFKSVAFENLIFFGALLYILIRRIGGSRALLVSGISFGIYHWFSWNLWGQPGLMALVFLTTGVAGYLWALAFYRTGSVYLSFGLHFGVNFVTGVIFSNDTSMGNQLFLRPVDRGDDGGNIVLSVLVMVLYFIGFPLLSFLYIRTLRMNKAGNQAAGSKQ